MTAPAWVILTTLLVGAAVFATLLAIIVRDARATRKAHRRLVAAYAEMAKITARMLEIKTSRAGSSPTQGSDHPGIGSTSP